MPSSEIASSEIASSEITQPRSNGELVFDAPWQSRSFGLAAAAVEAGHFTWSDFQKYLIAEIGTAEAGTAEAGAVAGGASPTETSPTETSPTETSPTETSPIETSTDEPAGYYRCWLAALERLLTEAGKTSPDEINQAEINQRAEQYAAREPGHDHSHSHPHDHSHDHSHSHPHDHSSHRH